MPSFSQPYIPLQPFLFSHQVSISSFICIYTLSIHFSTHNQYIYIYIIQNKLTSIIKPCSNFHTPPYTVKNLQTQLIYHTPQNFPIIVLIFIQFISAPIKIFKPSSFVFSNQIPFSSHFHPKGATSDAEKYLVRAANVW